MEVVTFFKLFAQRWVCSANMQGHFFQQACLPSIRAVAQTPTPIKGAQLLNSWSPHLSINMANRVPDTTASVAKSIFAQMPPPPAAPDSPWFDKTDIPVRAGYWGKVMAADRELIPGKQGA